MQRIKILAIVEITKLIIRHIFLKAQVTSKKMNRNKGHNFWAYFYMSLDLHRWTRGVVEGGGTPL